MNSTDKLTQLAAQLYDLKEAATALARSGEDTPAIACNMRRVLASIKMLELNIADVVPTEW